MIAGLVIVVFVFVAGVRSAAFAAGVKDVLMIAVVVLLCASVASKVGAASLLDIFRVTEQQHPGIGRVSFSARHPIDQDQPLPPNGAHIEANPRPSRHAPSPGRPAAPVTEPDMEHGTRRNAIEVMLSEHRRLASVVSGMLRVADGMASGAGASGAMLMRAMLYYIREFPDQIHHPKEEQYLFARLRECTDECDAVIEALERQHEEGEQRVSALERALTRYELAGADMLSALRDEVIAYAEFYANHRHLEESVILPAAQRYLTTADWVEIDEAFGANRDPFESLGNEEHLDDLYTLIVQTVPDARS